MKWTHCFYAVVWLALLQVCPSYTQSTDATDLTTTWMTEISEKSSKTDNHPTDQNDTDHHPTVQHPTDNDHSVPSNNGSCPSATGHCDVSHLPEHYHVASLNWSEVYFPFLIGIWILIASIAKIVFHLTKLPDYIPESCVLITVGFLIGAIVRIVSSGHQIDAIFGKLDSELFFLYLLPPIILEAGYFMPARSFFNNIGTILTYAVVGTLFNAFCIGLSLYGISELGWFGKKIQFLELVTFSSLISAVDPVAVLAVFEEIHVNQVLYILVFGESLLNDAVTVVLYRMFNAFDQISEHGTLTGWDQFLGFVSFFVVSIGGIVIGLIYGFLTALISKYTEHIRVIEPVFVFVMSYLAYITAEMFQLSSILSIVACAMFMKPYVERNISKKSHTTIKYFMKMLASLSETIIFIFLGISTVAEPDVHEFNIVFILFTLFFCSLYRALGVLWQTYICNKFRLVKVNPREQFIMAYGGIRGAIAFSLVALLCAETFSNLKIIFTTTIIVVMFTVFIQGATIKPLVDILHVKKEEKCKPSMNEEIFSRFNDHLMAGLEMILGHGGSNAVREYWHYINERYFKRMLVSKSSTQKDPKIIQVYNNLTQKDAQQFITTHGSFFNQESIANMLRVQLTSSSSMSSFSNLPVNNCTPCLDMQQTEVTVVPGKDKEGSQLHHRELFQQNVHKTNKLNSLKVSRNMWEDEPDEKLMYRSMQIHMGHINKKRNKRKRHLHPKMSKTHSRPSHSRLYIPVSGSTEGVQHGKNHGCNVTFDIDSPFPKVVITPDDDDIITFTAKKYEPEDVPDAGSEAPKGPKLSLAESTLPWRSESSGNVELSVRAQHDPHEPFGHQTPPSSPMLSMGERTYPKLGDPSGDNAIVDMNVGKDENSNKSLTTKSDASSLANAGGVPEFKISMGDENNDDDLDDVSPGMRFVGNKKDAENAEESV